MQLKSVMENTPVLNGLANLKGLGINSGYTLSGSVTWKITAICHYHLVAMASRSIDELLVYSLDAPRESRVALNLTASGYYARVQAL
jgi:hypothetical protein